MVALYTYFYNFIRTHKTLRVTPAMETGLADTHHSFEDIIGRVDANNPPKKRGAYKRQPSDVG